MSSKVYFIKASAAEGQEAIAAKAVKLFSAGQFARCFAENDFTAVKVHVGEGANNTHVKAGYIKGLTDELLALKTKPFITDTSTLYSGRRRNAIDHTVMAAEHGFSLDKLGVPFITADGVFGTAETAVAIEGELNKEVFIAYDIARCQSILSVAHFTGHPAACAGATIKTLGMGCATKKGKLTQHAALKLSISDSCTLCGQCYKHCPAEAITLGDVQAHIEADKCISCAECLAVCRFSAVQCNWGEESQALQQHTAEYALGALKGKEDRAVFFNFLINITKDCDCFGSADMASVVDDIGILASTDPVAVDKAAIDMVEAAASKKLGPLIGNDQLDASCQIRHAEKIGLGSAQYEVVKVR
ncbi:MAG: DUF362 domain-containing protein [Sedimentisphaerales bacterium]|nr:DUF362 domain-containing protein [Sedimentisphaerales bacterium]